MITSESNANIKQIVKLQKSARERNKEKCFVTEGKKMVEEAFAAGKLLRVYLAESFSKELHEDRAAWKDEIPCEVVTDHIFSMISETVTPQGVLGIVSKPVYSLETILEKERKKFILLDDLRDPGNLGTIMRTAEGAGMTAVILSRESVDLFNPKVVRATMGSIFRMPFYYAEELTDVIGQMKRRQISVIGCTMEGSIKFNRLQRKEGVALVIGNEANGLSESVREYLTDTVRIPMAGKLESLNAAVAAAILMYQVSEV